MLAKIAAVLAVLFAALTAPVIVSEIDATPEPARVQDVGKAPEPPATATPYPLADDRAPTPTHLVPTLYAMWTATAQAGFYKAATQAAKGYPAP